MCSCGLCPQSVKSLMTWPPHLKWYSLIVTVSWPSSSFWFSASHPFTVYQPSQNWLISSTSEMPFKVNVIHNEVELTLKSYEILHFTPLKLLFLYDIIWCNFVFIYHCLFASLECKLSEVRLSLLLIPRAYNSVCTEYMFSSGWASQVLQQSININPQLTSPQSNNIL